MTRIELGGAAAPAAGRLMVAGSSDEAMRSADRLEIPDELPDLERGPEDPTAIRTVLIGTTGVLIAACGSCCGRGSGCITCAGGAVFFSSGSSLISGRLAWVEDESDRRSPFWKLLCRPPLGWLVVLRRTTLLRAGAGLVSRLRIGEDGRDDGNCALPARAGRLISRGRMLSLAGSFSSGTEDVDAFIALRLVITREAGRTGGEDWRTGGEDWRTGGGDGWRTGGEVWRTGGEDGRRGRPEVLWAGGPAAAWPSPRRALVRALSFMGTGISSSELSFKVEYCWGCELDSLLTGGAATALPAGCDSLRLS